MELLTVPFEFDYDRYLTEIRNMLADPETVFYFDTCFLAQMYKFNSDIRNDFYTWVNGRIDSLRIPHWVYCEYTKRSVIAGGLKEFYPLTGIKKKVKNLTSDFQLLKGLLDSKKLSTMKYTRQEDFLDDLSQTGKILDKIVLAFKSNDEIESIKEEINRFLSKIIMTNDIRITKDIETEFAIRRENKIPPGFAEFKEENVIGDFIIWKEIVNDAKKNAHKKVIFLTNDMKKDWVYLPQRIKYKNRSIPNPNEKNADKLLPAKITDPRIEKEFYDEMGTQTFYVVSFNIFSSLLADMYPTQYPNLPLASEEEPNEISQKVDEASEENNGCSGSESATATILGIEGYGITDSVTLVSKNSEYKAVIAGFKSYNWYKQSNALDDARKLDFGLLSSTELFILGRNIYQSACGGEYDAVYLLNNPDYIEKYFNNNSGCKYIVMGMLFEVYFDSKGNLRKEFKNKYLQRLFSLRKLYYEEFKKVGDYLKSKSNNFVYYPGDDGSFVFTFNNIELPSSVFEVASIKINGYEILTDPYEENSVRHYFSLTRDYYAYESMKDIFSVRLCIPYDLIDFQSVPNEKAHITIKKFITINSKENNCYKH